MDTKKDAYFHRELSSGCFSETNQMRLTKDSPIEIYRARLPGSVRLVVSHCLGILSTGDADISASIILMSYMSLAKMYGDILFQTVVTTEHLWDSLRLKVRSLSRFPRLLTKLIFITVLRVLGIYSMDELNRTDWDKLGKYRARKGPDYIAKYCCEIFT
jgi:hypothetical protein